METETESPPPPTPEEIQAELNDFNARVDARTAAVVVVWESHGERFRVGVLPAIVVNRNRKDLHVVGEKLVRNLLGEETWTPYSADTNWMGAGMARALLQIYTDSKTPVIIDLGDISVRLRV